MNNFDRTGFRDDELVGLVTSYPNQPRIIAKAKVQTFRRTSANILNMYFVQERHWIHSSIEHQQKSAIPFMLIMDLSNLHKRLDTASCRAFVALRPGLVRQKQTTNGHDLDLWVNGIIPQKRPAPLKVTESFWFRSP